MRRAALFLAALPLCACALWPLGEADCKGVNWRNRGYADGFGGNPPQDLRLVPECRERFGVEVDAEQYLAGWRDGYDEWDRLIGSTGFD